MSWLLKQAEDILNRVDQQTNAVLHQPGSKLPSTENQIEFIPNTPSFTPSIPLNPPVINNISTNRPATARRAKKKDEPDLISYLNSSTPITNNETTKKPVRLSSYRNRKSSSTTDDIPLTPPAIQSHNDEKEFVLNIPSTTQESVVNNPDKELIAVLQARIQTLIDDKTHCDSELQTYKRQQIQYQHQIAESDALLRDLRSRESDSLEILSAKDSQITLLRGRLIESDEISRTKSLQYEQLQDHTNLSSNQSQALDSLQTRMRQLEQEHSNKIERLNDEKQQLIEQLNLTRQHLNDEHLQLYDQQQQTKHSKNLIHQLEQDMNEYKAKAQRILQTKDKLISKLKDIAQHRSSTPTIGDQNDFESGNTHDVLDISLVGNAPTSSLISSNMASVQYEELKGENELFKQELQARELTIHTLRNELQEAEVLIQQADEQLHVKTNQFNEQLKDEHSHLILVEQDYRKLKEEFSFIQDDLHRQKQLHQGQWTEREHEIERLRSQLTSKTINHVKDDELEKRLQTLTESLIHKQTIIETLQIEKSSLKMQLERLEKRLDDYETINTNNALQQSSKPHQTTSISIDDNEHYENLRYRMPLLHETPYDVDITKKVKRAANELDKLGIRLVLFLRRYPAVRLAVLFYIILLHLWTFILLFTYTPETHSNTNPFDLKDKL